MNAGLILTILLYASFFIMINYKQYNKSLLQPLYFFNISWISLSTKCKFMYVRVCLAW